jgi:transcriptional regulator with XRE-family HTH domain
MPTTEIEQYIIDVVREKRKEAKLSQAALAHLLEVSEGYIGNIESPKYQDTYNVNHINKLAKIFKCSPRDFLPERSL